MKRLMTTAMGMAILSACGSAGPGPGSTPEETFARMKKVATDKNYKAAYGFMDPENVDVALAGMTMGASFVIMDNKEGAAELEALLTKYGYPKDSKMQLSGDKEKQKASVKEAFKGVSDKAGMFGDIVTFIEKHGKDNKGFRDFITDTTLKDLKIDGDRATAQAVTADGKKSNPMRFVKRNALWYVAAD